MLSVRAVGPDALETFLPPVSEASLGLRGFCDGLKGVEVELDVVKEPGELLLSARSKVLSSEDDSRLRPGMTRPVVNCD